MFRTFKPYHILFINLLILALFTVPTNGDRRISVTSIYDHSSEKRYALVIGNGKYEYAPLRNCENDAIKMANVLGNLNFEVHLELNQGQKAMMHSIDNFGEELKGGGVGLFYYSGHGMQVKGENFLIPIRASIKVEQDVEYDAVKVGRILAKMDAAQNSLNIVILDACRNNPFVRGFRSGQKGLAIMNAPSGTIIAYATAPGGTASDGFENNGLYTSILLHYMNHPGLKIEDLFKRVRIEVKKDTNEDQIPWESSSLVGDFYFNPPEVEEPIEEPMFGRISTTINVDGAKVTLGEFKLKTRKGVEETQYNIPTGRYKLVAKLEGYRTFYQSVVIEKDTMTAVHINMVLLNMVLYQDKLLQDIAGNNKLGREWKDEITGMEFIWVEGGCYDMECGWPSYVPCSRDDGKKMEKEVCLDSFWLGKYEVTQGQWKKLMGSNPAKFSKGDNYPVEQVSWNDAKRFIGELNRQAEGRYKYFLPSEAQWDYACRNGGEEIRDASESDYDTIHWYSKNGHNPTYPVGINRPNDIGIYDMYGNIWEWCEDIYSDDAYGLHNNKNPIYIGDGSPYRVTRGGCMSLEVLDSFCVNRCKGIQNGSNSSLGFRLLRKD